MGCHRIDRARQALEVIAARPRARARGGEPAARRRSTRSARAAGTQVGGDPSELLEPRRARRRSSTRPSGSRACPRRCGPLRARRERLAPRETRKSLVAAGDLALAARGAREAGALLAPVVQGEQTRRFFPVRPASASPESIVVTTASGGPFRGPAPRDELADVTPRRSAWPHPNVGRWDRRITIDSATLREQGASR